MQHIGMSPTMKGTIEAERLRRQGVDVVDLGAGEPDFPTPAHVTAAAHAALDKQFTKYTANMGITGTARGRRRRATSRTTASRTQPDEVIITAGGKQALYHAALALFGPGDEVITHAPGWPTIVEQIKLAGATPVVVRTRAGGRLRADGGDVSRRPSRRARAASSSTRRAIRPARCCPRPKRETLAARRGAAGTLGGDRPLLRAADLRQRAAQPAEDLRRRRCAIGWCWPDRRRRAYAMTGWRCGWMVGPKPVVSAANALQSHATSNVNSITQKAAVAALTGPQQCVTDMLDEYQTRRDQVLAWLARGAAPALRACRRARSICFRTSRDFLSPDRSADVARVRRRPAARGARGDDRRRGVRRAGLSPPVVRDVARAAARRRDAADSLRARRSAG